MLWYGDVLVAVHDNQSAGDKIVVSHRIIKMFFQAQLKMAEEGEIRKRVVPSSF